jgi:ElaB/YqjD/DUF883 family membrane-anchored ribosome-binding protein
MVGKAAAKVAAEDAKREAKKLVEAQKARAEKEVAKIRKQVEGQLRKVDSYIEKNPEKAALITAGLGAALGAATALLLSGGKKRKK